jgi:signal transduction histidine kinase
LGNPLNVAGGRVDLVRDEINDEHLETAAKALDRMNKLGEDTLALAQ